MHPPVNFDSVTLDAMLSDWLRALGEFSVEAVVVLGPDPFANANQRLVLALHPPRLIEGARALAESRCAVAGLRCAARGVAAHSQVCL